jgi:hypothetical protein
LNPWIKESVEYFGNFEELIREEDPVELYLHDRMEFGSVAEVGHMAWENKVIYEKDRGRRSSRGRY